MIKPLKILFAKTKPEAIIPSKREEDGAFDIYACFEEDYMIIKPHETKLIPTGLASAFNDDYVALLKERGSTGVKGIGQRAGVIDSGYRNEWFVPLTNHNNEHLVISKEGIEADVLMRALTGEHSKTISVPFQIYPYEKAIAQCIMVEVPKIAIQEVPYADLLTVISERGLGKLGSSGK